MRQRMIDSLQANAPAIHDQYTEALREHAALGHVTRNSGRYPFTGRGRINTYAVFAETNRYLVSRKGRIGCIVQSGIATDDTTKHFFQNLIDTRSLVSLYDFENRNQIFDGVHRSFRFSLLTIAAPHSAPNSGEFAFFLGSVNDLNHHHRRFTLSAEDIVLLNPNTRTCPVFPTNRDAQIAKTVYRQTPVVLREGTKQGSPWNVQFKQGLFNMATDSNLFRSRVEMESEGMILDGNVFHGSHGAHLPLYEAKMMSQFNHRHGSITGSADLAKMSGIAAQPTTLEQYKDSTFFVLPRYWVAESVVYEELKRLDMPFRFLLVFRDVARATDARTAVHCVLPLTAVGHKAPLIIPRDASACEACALLASLNSIVYDYLVRQKFGSASLSFFVVKQTPCPPPEIYRTTTSFGVSLDWFVSRVLELSYTAWDLEAFALDCRYNGPPFRWDERRRFLLRCELDAAYFHIYSIKRDDLDYIMDTFPIVRRKDEAANGEYRTKRVILEIYDAMAEAIRTGRPYQTRLDPPPGPPTDPEGNFLPVTQWDPANWPLHVHQLRHDPDTRGDK
jgi:hypothetical protein